MVVEESGFFYPQDFNKFYDSNNGGIKSDVKLKTNIMILQAHNGEEFAKKFKELGVNTVIYFTYIEKHDKSAEEKILDKKYKVEKEINNEFTLSKVVDHFTIKFTKEIMGGQTVSDAFQNAKMKYKNVLEKIFDINV